MPTALPLAFCEADARPRPEGRLGIANDADFAVVAVFAAVGLALTIGFALFFPHGASAAALAWSMV